ncbi:MAG: hypothetical protein ACRC92_14750 [Peptostreptococcaceae bacterium]
MGEKNMSVINTSYQKVKDRKDLFVIAIDGLDCSGKETFTKSLSKVIEQVLSGMGNVPFSINNVSFPRYNSPLGKKIKSELIKDVADRDQYALQEWFTQDRIEYFKEYAEGPFNYIEGQVNIVICDRFSYANLIYEHLNIMPLTDTPEYYTAQKKIVDRFMNEFKHLPKPNLTILFNRTTPESEVFHRELLAKKDKDDTNESEELQSLLSGIISNTLVDIIKPTTDELVIVPIGSNFDSIEIEKAIGYKILNHFYNDLKMNTIMYPSDIQVFNRETEKLIKGLRIRPTVEMKFVISEHYIRTRYDLNFMKNGPRLTNMLTTEPDENITIFENLLLDIKALHNNLERSSPLDMVSIQEMLDTIGKGDDNNLQYKYGFVKYFANRNVFDLEYYKSLIHSLYLKFDDIFKDDPSVHERIGCQTIANTVMESFKPFKRSPLASSYILRSMDVIELEPMMVKEYTLPIHIHSIKGLTSETINKVIDIDVRTSKECVLKHKVYIADSPSNIAFDNDGEISVVLVNHSTEHVRIKVGEPIANIIITRSSCETDFEII